MQDVVSIERLFSKRLDCQGVRAVFVLFVFCSVFFGAVSGGVVYAQEQGAVAEGSSDDLGLDSLDTAETAGAAEALPEADSPSAASEISPEQPSPLGDGESAAAQQETSLTGLPPQPEQNTGGASVDLPGLDVPVTPEVPDAPPQQAKTEEGFDKMLERKGKPQSPTADSIKQKMAEDDRSPFKPEKIRSLFFTYWQHEAIVDAKKSRGRARPPTESELKSLDGQEPPKPGERDLTLNGIVFVTTDDWTIWLNGMRVTPSAIPKEVIDLRVYKEFIEVKWLDEYTNQVFPIRLRAHQRFNLDMRIFLPG